MTAPGALPTRDELAVIVQQGVCRVCKLPYPEHVKGKDANHNFDNDPTRVADALLARLRPAWDAELLAERRAEEILAYQGEIAALRADVARLERQVNASVTTENYKALVLRLGEVNADLQRVTAEKQALWVETDKRIRASVNLVDAKNEDLRACAEALREVERHCPCGARPESPDTHPHVTGCPVGAALARTGVQAGT